MGEEAPVGAVGLAGDLLASIRLAKWERKEGQEEDEEEERERRTWWTRIDAGWMEGGEITMERLSNELLCDILDFIQADPDQVVSVDRRAYLSVESFKAPSPPSPAQAQDVASFRLVCRRFAELGAPYQFTRVTTRFSIKGFSRLDGIAASPDVARHVKKFSYMIPCFYLEGTKPPF